MAEFPESELIRKTFIVREMDLPPNVKLTRRSLLRWFALGFGLISEKESRTTVFEILDALFTLTLSKNQPPTTPEVRAFIKERSKKKVSEKLIRYHLNKLIGLNILQRKKMRYSFNPSPNAEREDLKSAFNFHVTNSLQKTATNLEEVFRSLSESYKK